MPIIDELHTNRCRLHEGHGAWLNKPMPWVGTSFLAVGRGDAMALGLFKRWFGGDSRNSADANAATENESARKPDAAPDEPAGAAPVAPAAAP